MLTLRGMTVLMFHQGLLSGQEACRTVGRLAEQFGEEKEKLFILVK